MIHIEKIGDSEPEPLGPAARPLSGLRVLGMYHVIAGPTIARQLAAQGADCMNIVSPHWQEERMDYYQADTGSRQAMLDGRLPENKKRVYELVKDADIFIENLRPGLANTEDYRAEELAQLHPKITSRRFSPSDASRGLVGRKRWLAAKLETAWIRSACRSRRCRGI